MDPFDPSPTRAEVDVDPSLDRVAAVGARADFLNVVFADDGGRVHHHISVVAKAPHQRLIRAKGLKPVRAIIAEQDLRVVARSHRVIANAIEQRVGTTKAEQRVIVLSAGQAVVGRGTRKNIIVLPARKKGGHGHLAGQNDAVPARLAVRADRRDVDKLVPPRAGGLVHQDDYTLTRRVHQYLHIFVHVDVIPSLTQVGLAADVQAQPTAGLGTQHPIGRVIRSIKAEVAQRDGRAVPAPDLNPQRLDSGEKSQRDRARGAKVEKRVALDGCQKRIRVKPSGGRALVQVKIDDPGNVAAARNAGDKGLQRDRQRYGRGQRNLGNRLIDDEESVDRRQTIGNQPARGKAEIEVDGHPHRRPHFQL